MKKRHTHVDAQKASIALGLPLKDICPSRFSVKEGSDAFAICDQWGKPGHESRSSCAHEPVDGWNSARMREKFCRTIDQRPSPSRSRSRSPPKSGEKSRSSSPGGRKKPSFGSPAQG